MKSTHLPSREPGIDRSHWKGSFTVTCKQSKFQTADMQLVPAPVVPKVGRSPILTSSLDLTQKLPTKSPTGRASTPAAGSGWAGRHCGKKQESRKDAIPLKFTWKNAPYYPGQHPPKENGTPGPTAVSHNETVSGQPCNSKNFELAIGQLGKSGNKRACAA